MVTLTHLVFSELQAKNAFKQQPPHDRETCFSTTAASPLAMLLLLPWLNAPAFVLMPANVTGRVGGDLSRLTDFAFRWDTPAQSSLNGGLGGGISWVLDPSFCDTMLPRFPEESVAGGFMGSFVSCIDIKDAFARGFATWSANHKHVRFRNVLDTQACATSSPDVDDDPCPWELYVSTDDGVEYPTLAAYVINHRASAYGGPWWEESVRSPAGVVVSGVDPLRRSVMRFQTHICWYLDATFCYYFHSLEDDHGIDVLLMMRLVLFLLFGLALSRMLFIVLAGACAFGCRDAVGDKRPGTAEARREIQSARNLSSSSGSLGAATSAADSPRSPRVEAMVEKLTTRCGGPRLVRLLDYLATVSPLSTIVVIFFCVFPPSFYDRIFLPCWECYDFEAAVAHEIGHVLGFAHPDTAPTENLEQVANLTNATCTAPWGCAELVDYDATNGESIMHSLTRNKPRTCLSESDMAGLYLLYPVCDEEIPLSVSCTKATRLSGWLRLASVVGVPLIIALVVIMIPLHFLRQRERRRLRKLAEDLEGAGKAVRSLRASLVAVASSGLRPISRQISGLRPGSTSRVHPAPVQGVAVRGSRGVSGGGGGGAANGGSAQLLVVEEFNGALSTANGASAAPAPRSTLPSACAAAAAAVAAATAAPAPSAAQDEWKPTPVRSTLPSACAAAAAAAAAATAATAPSPSLGAAFPMACETAGAAQTESLSLQKTQSVSRRNLL